MSRLKYLVIHCTDTPAGRNVSSQDIRNWHTWPPPKGRGWHQVGYSDMIHLNGTLTNLVPYNSDDNVDPWEVTNGVKGVNGISRHVVVVGGKDVDNRHRMDTRTPAQKMTLGNYVRQTISQHPNIVVAGHYQFNPGKVCPGFDVPLWLRGIGIEWKNIKR